jgi:arabinofuranan 3-O-arabinosyltransferase
MLGYVYQNPPLVGMILAALLVTPAIVALTSGRVSAQRALRALVIGFPLLLVLSVYWIVPAAIHISSVASSQLAAISSWSWTEARATVANAFWLNTSWAWIFREYVPFAPAYESFPLAILKFALPALAFGTLVAIGHRPKAEDHGRVPRLTLAVAMSTLALILILLSTGTNFPGNVIFNRLYRLPLGWLLREPGRFLMAAGLMYAVLVGIVIEVVFAAARSRGWDLRGIGIHSRLRSVFPAVIAAAVVAPGFPLYTGAIVPDSRPVLPPAHVHMPGYWTRMAGYINGLPGQESMLVLPPDDFYQMPYSWGYYGSDQFIVDFVARPVLVPTLQGYTPAADELARTVDLTTQALLSGNWNQAEAFAKILQTRLVLVRGDVMSSFGDRVIRPPVSIANALKAAPNFDLIHREGPLELFALRAEIPPVFEAAKAFAIIDTGAPDLRLLSALPEGTALVSGRPLYGVPVAHQAPPIANWHEAGTELTWDTPTPSGWTYRLVILGTDRNLEVPVRPGALNALPKHIVAKPVESKSSGSNLHVTLEGRSAIDNGDFKSGLWGPVGDCYNVGGRSAHPYLHAGIVKNGGPDGLPALRLSAAMDSACESQQLSWHGGAVVVSLRAHHVAGAWPRLCLWEEGAQRCAQVAEMSSEIGWTTYRATITPDPGSTALALFVYADAASPGLTTTNEYADVRILELPALPQLVLVGTPDGTATSSNHLAVLHNTYSSNWQGPAGSQHVLVDGMLNGWLTTLKSTNLSAQYAPRDAVKTAFWVAGIGVGLLLLIAISVGRSHLFPKTAEAASRLIENAE